MDSIIRYGLLSMLCVPLVALSDTSPTTRPSGWILSTNADVSPVVRQMFEDLARQNAMLTRSLVKATQAQVDAEKKILELDQKLEFLEHPENALELPHEQFNGHRLYSVPL